MKRAYYIVLFFLFSVSAFGEVNINEIMYNPAGSDNYKEYIEVLTDYDLTGFFISDGDSNDSLVLLNKSDSGLALIVEDNYIYNLSNCSVYSAGATIGNGLSQDDTIYIFYPNGSLIQKVKINSSLGENNGKSMSYYNSSWIELEQSPCKENMLAEETEIQNQTISKDLLLEVYLDEFADINAKYTQLFKITNLGHVSGTTDNITVFVFYNVTKDNKVLKKDIFNVIVNSHTTSGSGEIVFNKTGNYVICGKIINSSAKDINNKNDFACKEVIIIDTSNISCNISLTIDLDNLIFNDSEKIGFYNKLNNESFLFRISYWIEDLFGNIIKKPYSTENTNKKSYTPCIDESDQVLIIKSNLTYIACNDTSLDDNYAEKLIIIKGRKELNSSIEIEDIYLGTDNTAKFGEFIRIRVKAYKGNTSGSSVKAWLEANNEKISYITQSNVYANFQSMDFTIPVRLKSNCNRKYKNGYYTLIVAGLDTSDSKNIYLNGITNSLCPKSSAASTESSEEKSIEPYELTGLKEEYYCDEKIEAVLKINNDDKSSHEYTAWSYIYRGPKCYSGERTENSETYKINPLDSKTIQLINVPVDITEGDYKIKIKIKKDEQKTEHEITRDIKFIQRKNEIVISFKKPEIKRFYTLSKKLSENINLYATIDNFQNNLTLVLDSVYGTDFINPEDSKTKINVDISPGRNIFLLNLIKDNEIIDTKELIIMTNETEIKAYENSVEFYNENPDIENKKPETQTTEGSLITGNAVKQEYISSSEKAKRIIPLLIIVLTVCIGIILVKKDRK